MNLGDLPVQQPAHITGTAADHGGTILLRLMEMGLVPGAAVEVRKRAPLGGPLEIRVEGYLLSIRRADAQLLSVEPDAQPADEARTDTAPAGRGGEEAA